LKYLEILRSGIGISPHYPDPKPLILTPSLNLKEFPGMARSLLGVWSNQALKDAMSHECISTISKHQDMLERC